MTHQTREINFFDEVSSSLEEESHTIEEEVKGAIEAMLFTSSQPISFRNIRAVIDGIIEMKPREIKAIIAELKEEYDRSKRAFQLDEIAEGYILRTRAVYASYVEILHNKRRSEKLSRPATEVLAIIAYQQPVIRSKIDAIRGVDSSGTLYSLLDRDLIEVVGRLDAPGRPALYATTKRFMEHFGLREMGELPTYEEPEKDEPQKEEVQEKELLSQQEESQPQEEELQLLSDS